jgi:hypothetical protein
MNTGESPASMTGVSLRRRDAATACRSSFRSAAPAGCSSQFPTESRAGCGLSLLTPATGQRAPAPSQNEVDAVTGDRLAKIPKAARAVRGLAQSGFNETAFGHTGGRGRATRSHRNLTIIT